MFLMRRNAVHFLIQFVPRSLLSVDGFSLESAPEAIVNIAVIAEASLKQEEPGNNNGNGNGMGWL